MERIIASNAKFQFHLSAEHSGQLSLIDLTKYRVDSQVNEIILLCSNIMDVTGMEEMRTLLDYIRTYPTDIPVYMMSIGAKLPNDNFEAFKNETRDILIRNLIEEVCKRSKSIGVRGCITRRWLVEFFKFDKDMIDLVYDWGNPSDSTYISKYIAKTYPNCPFPIHDFMEFNGRPVLANNICNSSTNRDVIISRPKLEYCGDKVRLHFDIHMDGKIRPLYFEYDAYYAQALNLDTVDGALIGLIPLALRDSRNIVCDGPVSGNLLHNIREILIPGLCIGDPRLYRSKVIAERFLDDSSTIGIPRLGTAICFSGGVDSFYSLLKYYKYEDEKLRAAYLYTGNYSYTKDMKIIHQRAVKVADSLKLKVILQNTNFNEIFYEYNHLYTHFFKTLCGVFPLAKLLNGVVYNSGYDYTHHNVKYNATEDTARYELLLIYALSTPEFSIIYSGAEVTRLQKISALLNFPLSYHNLNVCLEPGRHVNCGVCDKCVRTLLALDYLDALHLYTDVFNITAYKAKRSEYINKMKIEAKWNRFMKEIYLPFMKKSPELFDK